MGNSHSVRDPGYAPNLNTRGKVISAAVGMFPGFGPMLIPIFEKIALKLSMFQTKPKLPYNETMQTMEQIADRIEAAKQAPALLGDAGASESNFQIRFLEDARKETLEALGESKHAKEEVEKLQRRVQEAESRQHAAETEPKHLRAELEEARQQEAAARSREKEANAKLTRCYQLDMAQLPSKQEMQAARNRIKYSDEKYHFALCGFTGTGKSSLINSFRGLRAKDKGAAPVGTDETTTNITRYPDPSSEPPYSRFVWYDIPGGGTAAVSSEKYYKDQGLYAFDAVIVVYDDRFTELDESIIKDCVRHNTPVFIVRSKADQHIDNKIRDENGFTRDDDEYNVVYPEVQAKYVKESMSFVDRCLKRMANDPDVNERDRYLLQDRRWHRVYIVSALNLLPVVKSYRDNSAGSGSIDDSKIIDEGELIDQMLLFAGERRGVRMG
ncbi:hypothetical protein KC19_3G032800 [Ceratodon purpureus]|uniref:IRG-type G domain-containing protein n=1 Tax=Ceratodon purpureus TaxID=3225 RepID=A0A8T0IEA7_CERPU|nr:hypothetical protein KC19_3G032800 [Ceratodon purpureus]